MIIILQDKDLSESNKGKESNEINIKDFPIHIHKFIKQHKSEIDLYFVPEFDSSIEETQLVEISTPEAIYYTTSIIKPV